MIGILALQGDFQAHAGALARLDAPSRFVRTPEDLAAVSALILPGGESTTLLRLLESEGLWEPLRQFGQSHPMMGTCAGAILMADAVENPAQPSFGFIRMTVRRNAYGRQLSSSIRHAEVSSRLNGDQRPGAPLEAVLIRAPIITEVGPAVEVLASLEGHPILVLQGHFLAATFHPELTADVRVHRYFQRIVSGRAA
ncbi:MAG TPA: pyridoxal 5'-phosphate synthase glutaminase subunit PdxT [Terriglobia bacterium]|jgi:5'-phosphate synthase pdxT subunit